MKTKTIELYEFDELPEAVKAKIIERNRDINTDHEWHDFLIEDWEEKLKDKGFNTPEISFSGFASQGDGASFTCDDIDIDKFLTAQKLRGKFKTLLKALNSSGVVEVIAKVERRDNHYVHKYTVDASVEIGWYASDDSKYTDEKFTDKAEEEGRVLEGEIISVVRDLSEEIYRELEEEYFYLSSDEQIVETIKDNEYTFTIDGRMENE